MTATLKQIVIAGIEIPLDPAEERLVRVAEEVEAIERAEAFDLIVSTGSSYYAPRTGAPSSPLSPGVIRVMNSVLNSRVKESAILRDTNGDW